MIDHYVQCCKTKLTKKSDDHKDNSRQNLHPGETMNRYIYIYIYIYTEVYSDNDEYLCAVKDSFKV